MAMRRAIAILVLTGVALLVLPTLSFRGGRASADGEDPAILLDSVVDDVSFGQGPFDAPPPAMFFGFGLYKATTLDISDVIFDLSIQPSALEQRYTVSVGEDEAAASLADAVQQAGREGASIGFNESFHADQHVITFGDDSRMRLPTGAHVTYFKLVVSPFSIEKMLSTGPPGSTPVHGYRIVPVGPTAVVEAWGTPPPGDASCDASVDSRDAAVMLQHGAGLLDTVSCAKAADVNADGAIDARDAQLVLQFSAGLIGAL
jgi:hypothetical protein